MAPELLDVEDDEETVSASVTPQSDVYALAMTMWEVSVPHFFVLC